MKATNRLALTAIFSLTCLASPNFSNATSTNNQFTPPPVTTASTYPISHTPVDPIPATAAMLAAGLAFIYSNKIKAYAQSPSN